MKYAAIAAGLFLLGAMPAAAQTAPDTQTPASAAVDRAKDGDNPIGLSPDFAAPAPIAEPDSFAPPAVDEPATPTPAPVADTPTAPDTPVDRPAPPTPDAPAAEPAPIVAFTLDTPIELLLADFRAKAVLDKDLPGMSTDQNLDKFKSKSLRELQPLTGGQLTEALLEHAGEDLAAITTGEPVVTKPAKRPASPSQRRLDRR